MNPLVLKRAVSLVPDDQLRNRLLAALTIIDEITHEWTRSGFADKCASCGLEPGAIWHAQAMNLIREPESDNQEALL